MGNTNPKYGVSAAEANVYKDIIVGDETWGNLRNQLYKSRVGYDNDRIDTSKKGYLDYSSFARNLQTHFEYMVSFY